MYGMYAHAFMYVCIYVFPYEHMYVCMHIGLGRSALELDYDSKFDIVYLMNIYIYVCIYIYLCLYTYMYV